MPSTTPLLSQREEDARVFDLEISPLRERKDSRAIDFATRRPGNFIQILCRSRRYRLLFQLRRGGL